MGHSFEDSSKLKAPITGSLSALQRIGGRLALSQAAILVVVLVAGSWLFQRHQVLQAKLTLVEQGHTLLPFIVPSVRPALDVAYDEFSESIDESLIQTDIIRNAFALVHTNQYIGHIEILLANGKPLLQEFTKDIPREDLQVLLQTLPAQGRAQADNEQFVVQQIPIPSRLGDTPLGTLRLSFSLAPVHARMRASMAVTSLIALALFAVAMLIAVSSGNVMLYRPMHALVARAAHIARGDLQKTRHRGTMSTGEIGQIQRAFDHMTEALRDVIGGAKNIAASVQNSVRGIERSSSDMLQGAKAQQQRAARILDSVAASERSSNAVHHSMSQLAGNAEQAADITGALSQRLNALSPRVVEFGDFVQDTDRFLQKLAQSSQDVVARVHVLTQASQEAADETRGFQNIITQIGQSADSAARTSEGVTNAADSCRAAVTSTIDGMRAIAESFRAMEAAVDALGERLDAMGNITSVIEEITSRTKLLSLNASILASQAGEHGKGFSVVADEIKALSERTTSSTKEIGELIATIQQDRRQTSDTMANGLERIHEGRKLSQIAGSAIADILRLTAANQEHVGQIASETAAQVSGSQRIALASRKIAEMGQGILKIATEQESESEAVKRLTGQLVKNVQAVLTALQRDAAQSVNVSQQIDSTRQLALAARQEASKQRQNHEQLKPDITAMNDFANNVLREAEAVARDVTLLEASVQQLGESIEHFHLD